MKILVITNNPDRASFRQRIGMYLPMLADAGINCEVAELPKGFFKRRELFKKAGSFHAVFLHRKHLNFFDAGTLRKYAKKIIYDFDDAEMYSTHNPQKQSYSHYWPFKRTVSIADLVIAGNSYLASLARKYNTNVVILPTGLDTEKYKPEEKIKIDDKIRLVWIGSASTVKYLNEINDALEELGKQFNRIALRMICDEFLDFKNLQVEKIQWTLENEGKALMECDIGLAPLPDNNFTRGKCGFKILQYMAAGLPVVASPVGVNSDLVKNGVNGFHAKTSDQWIENISKLIKDPDLRQRTGEANLIYVRQYDMKIIGQGLCELIKNMAGKT